MRLFSSEAKDWKSRVVSEAEQISVKEAVNAIESVLRTELLDAMAKSFADACIRHGYCTAELI